jgi:uncharacterized protein YdhG (YjbR/CyaY superfamily)
MTSEKRTSPYGAVKFKTIDDYHQRFDLVTRKLLDEMRKIIGEAAPAASETISYNMPAFRQHQNLVYYAGFKDHISLFPTPSPLRAFQLELAKYKTSKGTIQFPLDKSLPKNLIKKIVKFRAAEDAEKASASKPKSASALQQRGEKRKKTSKSKS